MCVSLQVITILNFINYIEILNFASMQSAATENMTALLSAEKAKNEILRQELEQAQRQAADFSAGVLLTRENAEQTCRNTIKSTVEKIQRVHEVQLTDARRAGQELQQRLDSLEKSTMSIMKATASKTILFANRIVDHGLIGVLLP